DKALAEVRSLGKPAILIAPSPFHCIDAHAFKERMGVRVLCPARCAAEVGQRVALDGDYGALPDDPTLRAVTIEGTKTGESVFLLRSGERVTMLMCDVMLNVPNLPGFFGFVWKVMGFSGGPRSGPVWLKRAVSDRAALKKHLGELAATPGLARLVPS